MGSFIEINDTLRITKEQGFPAELDLGKHLKTPYTVDELADRVFHFKAKPDIRIYKVPPVRNFLVKTWTVSGCIGDCALSSQLNTITLRKKPLAHSKLYA